MSSLLEVPLMLFLWLVAFQRGRLGSLRKRIGSPPQQRRFFFPTVAVDTAARGSGVVFTRCTKWLAALQ